MGKKRKGVEERKTTLADENWEIIEKIDIS